MSAQSCRRAEVQGAVRLTLALQALPHEAPQQGAAVVAERRDLVVVNTELVGHVDAEALRSHLQRAIAQRVTQAAGSVDRCCGGMCVLA